LIRDEEVSRTKMALETSYCGKGDDGVDTDMFQGGYVCPRRNLGGGKDMSATMTSEESYGGSLGRTGDCNGGGGIAPGSQWVELGNVGEIAERVKACTADDSQSNRLYNSVSNDSMDGVD
jgi:hypothetical protein